jgi:hypothetical protein
VLNEIESLDSGGGVDWIEFRNPGAAPVNLSGWSFTDSDPLNVYTFPNDTIVAAGAYLVSTKRRSASGSARPTR